MNRRVRILRIGIFATLVGAIGIFGGRALLQEVVRHVAAARIAEALGVPCHIHSVRLAWRLDRVTFRGLRVGNPPPFDGADALSIEAIEVDFRLGEILHKPPRVRRVRIERPELLVERQPVPGGARPGLVNWGLIGANVAGGPGEDVEESEADSPGLSVDEVVVENPRLALRERTEGARDFTVSAIRLTMRNVHFPIAGEGETVLDGDTLLVSNPPGYSSDPFFRVSRAELRMAASSRQGFELRLSQVDLESPQLRFEVDRNDMNQDALLGFVRDGAEDFVSSLRRRVGGGGARSSNEPSLSATATVSNGFRFVLDDFQARAATVERFEEGRRRPIFEGEAHLRDFVYPASDASPLLLDVNGHPFAPSAEMSFHFKGTPQAPEAERTGTFELSIDRMPIAPLMRDRALQPGLGVKGGLMHATSQGLLVRREVESQVDAYFSNLELENRPDATLGQRTRNASLIAGAVALRKPGTADTVPVSFPLRFDAGNLRVGAITNTVIVATADAAVLQALNLASVGGSAVKTAARVTAEGGHKVIEEAGPASETIVEKSRDAIGAIGSFLGGLFSHEKKSEPKERDAPGP